MTLTYILIKVVLEVNGIIIYTSDNWNVVPIFQLVNYYTLFCLELFSYWEKTKKCSL